VEVYRAETRHFATQPSRAAPVETAQGARMCRSPRQRLALLQLGEPLTDIG
jgi:hypothetical protein